MSASPSSLETNLLLASLPAQKQRHLLRRCEVVTLQANEDLYEVGDSIEDVYFPKKGCLISLVKVLDDDEQRCAVHDRVRRIGVTQAVEVGLWLDPSAFAGVFHRPGLVRCLPLPAAILG